MPKLHAAARLLKLEKSRGNSSFWQRYRYKQLTYFLFSIVAVAFLVRVPVFHDSLLWLANTGYWGALIGGMLYVSAFTAAIGVLILLYLGDSLPLVSLSVVAGVGGVLADLIIFRLIRTTLEEELKSLYYRLGGRYISRLFTKKSPLHGFLPLLGALFISSPLPDEIGVSLLGVSKISATQFAVLTLFLNSVGVCLLVYFGRGFV